MYSGKHYAIVEASVGDIAGSLSSSSGYTQVKLNKVLYLGHIIVWVLHNGEIPEGLYIDHMNGDKQDNRISNLRLVDKQGNSRNCKLREDNTSGVKGVTFLSNKLKDGVNDYWVAFWSQGGKQRRKFFPIKDFGFEAALAAAISFREDKLNELNRDGYGYTDRHTNKLNNP